MKVAEALTIAEPSKPLSLRANFSWTFVGNVVYSASQWGMLALIARLGTPETVGQFALGLAVTAPVIMFSNLQLRAVQATDAKHDYTFGDYFGLRIITTLLALVIIVLISITSYQNEATLIIVLVGLAKAFESLSDVIYGLLQQQERMDRIAQAQMIKGPASLAILAAGMLLTKSLIGGVIGIALVWAIMFFFYDLNSARRLSQSIAELKPRWHLKRLVRLAWLALPLGFVMLLISLNTNIPRLFVERYLGEAQLGIFAAMAYLIIAGNTVVSALGQSASPRLAKYYSQGNNRAYRRLLLRLIGIGFGLGVVGVLVAIIFGEWLLNLVYGPEYAAEAGVFVWVMIAGGIGYIGNYLGYGMTAARVFKPQTIVYGITILTSFILCMMLMPEGSLLDAAIILIVANVVSLIISAAVLVTKFLTLNSKTLRES